MRFNGIPDILSKQMKIIPTIRLDQNNVNLRWPINFEIIHESLFNLLKTFSIYINDLNNYQMEYTIIFGNSTLYLQSKKIPNNFYVYSFDNNIIYKFIAFIIFQNDFFFQSEINQFLKDKTFKQYLLERNIDIKKLNQKQILKNSNNVIIAELALVSELDYNGNNPHHNQINLENNIFQMNENNNQKNGFNFVQMMNPNTINQTITNNQNNVINQKEYNLENLNNG